MDNSPTNTLWIFAWPLAAAPQESSALFPETTLQHNQLWQWGSLHGLQITETDLQARLTRLQAPALLIELCMGASWRLHVFPADDPPVFFTHDWKTGHTDPDCHLLEQSLQTLGRQAPAGLRHFLDSPPDPLAAQTPVGNLPQVLRLLDLPEVFPDWEDEHEQAQKTQLQQQQAELHQSGCASQVMARVAALAPQALAGGPLILPFQALSHLYRLAWLADDAASPVIILQGDSIQDAITWPPGGASHLEKTPDGIRIGLDLSPYPFRVFRWLDEALALLEPLLTAGLQWQLALAPIPLEPEDDDPENPAALQRYGGDVLEQGQLAITETFPALGAAELQRALGLAAWAAEGGRWTFPDASAAETFVAKAQTIGEVYSETLVWEGPDIWLDRQDPEDGWIERHFVARQIFLDYFGPPWDLSVSRPLYLDTADAPDSWRQLGRQLTQLIQKPHTGDVLLRGESGIFWLGAAQDLTERQQQALDLATAELQALQFQLLGDCVWEPGGDVFLRVFKHTQQPTYAGVLLGLFDCVTEFASYFISGAVLMTSPLDDAQHQPEQQVFKYSHPGILPADLWHAHLQHVSAFDQPLAPPAETLAAFLPQLDQLLALQSV